MTQPNAPKNEIEVADRRVWVYASLTVLQDMARDWVGPLEVNAKGPHADGSWDLIFRRPVCACSHPMSDHYQAILPAVGAECQSCVACNTYQAEHGEMVTNGV